MMFSVIIPVFNKRAYIAQTLASALAQQYADFEILVIDDGSTDGSAEQVASLDDPRVRLIRQANAGVAMARNRGIDEARGEWICFLDADDWQHPAYLLEQSETIRRFPAVDAVATRFKAIPDSPDWNPRAWPLASRQYELINDLPRRWMYGVPFFTGSIAIRRTLLTTEKPCFPPGESFGEDLDLWFRVAERTSIALLPQPLVAYRTAALGSLTATHGKSLLTPSLERMRKRASSLPPKAQRSMLRFVAQQYITQARLDAAQGQRASALAILLKVMAEGLYIRRWWVSLAMGLFFPRHLIAHWQTRREQRTAA